MILEPYQTYLNQVQIPLRLACNDRSGWPAVLSLWYLYRGGCLYCATQETAKVVAYLRDVPRCAFEVASDTPPYCGIRGRAEAQIMPQMGEEILVQLLHRYLGDTGSALATTLLKRAKSEVAICLQPVSVYPWNFTECMALTASQQAWNPCPDVQ